MGGRVVGDSAVVSVRVVVGTSLLILRLISTPALTRPKLDPNPQT